MADGTLPTYDYLLLERDGPLTWLTLNRPEKLNAMNQALLEELSDALRALATDQATRVIAIRGAGRAFSAGYDIERKDGAPVEEPDIVDDYLTHAGYLDRFLAIWDHPKPVIACVHGYCLAGATQLTIFCDLTVVAEDAVVGWPSIPLGGGYISPLWVPLVGPKRAKQMSYVPGSRITGQTAADWGWANFATPADRLQDEVRDLALRMARVPASTLRMKKMAINRVADAMGFRSVAPMGAETDALLHYSGDVKRLANAIQEHGLKETIARFNAGTIDEEPDERP
jgi:enoyl-CoA hydratase